MEPGTAVDDDELSTVSLSFTNPAGKRSRTAVMAAGAARPALGGAEPAEGRHETAGVEHASVTHRPALSLRPPARAPGGAEPVAPRTRREAGFPPAHSMTGTPTRAGRPIQTPQFEVVIDR